MSTQGWIFMLGSWFLIFAVFAYSMYRTLTAKEDSEDKKMERE
ncbi:MAG: hypothetical protein WCN95_14270 [bacterium]